MAVLGYLGRLQNTVPRPLHPLHGLTPYQVGPAPGRRRLCFVCLVDTSVASCVPGTVLTAPWPFSPLTFRPAHSVGSGLSPFGRQDVAEPHQTCTVGSRVHAPSCRAVPGTALVRCWSRVLFLSQRDPAVWGLVAVSGAEAVPAWKRGGGLGELLTVAPGPACPQSLSCRVIVRSRCQHWSACVSWDSSS